MGTASANLTKLGNFVTAANELLGGEGGLTAKINSLRASYDSFQMAPKSQGIGVGNPDLMSGSSTEPSELNRLVANYGKDALFVEAVRRAFELASGSRSGSVTVNQATFDTAFESTIRQVAAEYGVDYRVLLAERAPVTVDDPVIIGIPQTSGFVDDPICTASGHFLEAEDDFVWPERLGLLRWQRVYSSRFITDGPFGRGWASWATVACVPQADGTVGYHGPDGQMAIFSPTLDGAGYGRVSGVAATLVALPGGNSSGNGNGNGQGHGGWELRWEWRSQHPGEVWRFGPTGLLDRVEGLGCGTTTFRYAGQRLTTVDHDSGRQLVLDWDGERVVAVRSSCGRVARYHYNDAGDLARTERVLGERRYEADESGLILEVWDADGVRLCRNTYDGEGRVTMQVSPFGRETVLQYHPGNRTVVSDTGDGPVAVYEHDHAGRLIGLVDHLGHRMDRTFDAEGRCVSITGFDGAVARSQYEDDGRSASQISPDGVTERWEYDASERVTRHQVDGGPELRFDYVDNDVAPARLSSPDGWEMRLEVVDGLLRSITDADGVTAQLDYDGDGNLLATTNGLGATTRTEPHMSGEVARLTLPDGASFEFDRDDAGRLLGVRTPLGEQFHMEWSPAGRMTAMVEPNGARTAFEHGTHGAVERVIDALGATMEMQRDHLERLVGLTAPGGAKWGFSYTALGLLSMVADPAGGVWGYDYDAEGRMVAATDPLGHQMRQRYNPLGRLVEIVDRSGNATRFNHDALGRVVREVGPDGATTETDWDVWGRPTVVRFLDGGSVTYAYTPAGRVAGVTTAEGRGWTNSYDIAGRLAAVTDPAGATVSFEWDSCDRIVGTAWPSGRTDRYRYDALGRVVESERQGRTQRVEYDHANRVVATVDPMGATTRYAYDLRGKLTAATDPLGNTVRIRYDERGNATGIVDAEGGLVTTTYDGMRRPVVITDQLGRATRFERDLAGRVVRQEMATGDVVEWRRDPRGQVVDIRLNGRDAMVFERDPVGRPLLIHEPARNRTFTLTWTRGGQLAAVDIDGRTVRWDRDLDGLVVTRHDPTGRTTRYGRDLAGLLSSVEIDDWGTFELSRDPDGRLAALRGAGIERRWDHDADGFVAVTHRSGPDGQRSIELVRDDAGRVVEMRAGDQVTRYGYDAAGQLFAAATPTGAWTWYYDPAGRLAREDGPGGTRRFAYDAAHQLVHIDGPDGRATYGYDAAGRRIREDGPDGTGRSWTWDGLGRLTSIDSNGRHRDIDIDALGLLAAVDDTRLTWDPTTGVPELLAIGDRSVLTADGLALGVTGDDGTMSWLAGDSRGSTDWADGRDPWGRRDSSSSSGDGDVELGFLSEVDIDGLTWLQNRIYDPVTSAFLSPDPLPGVLGLPVASNPYHYANNNPVNFVDPLGLRPLSIAEYNEYRKTETGVQWGNIVTGLAIVGGVALMFVPGVNLIGGILIGAALGAVAGAAPGLTQGINAGKWDWGSMGAGALKGAIIGGLSAGLGGGFGAAASRFVPAGSRLANTLIGGGGVFGAMGRGGVLGMASGALGEAYDLTPLPGSDGQFDGENIAINGIIGAGSGGAAKLALQRAAVTNGNAEMNAAQADGHRGLSGAITAPDGTVFPARSVSGNPPTLNPRVSEVLDTVDPQFRSRGHGKCWEPQSVSDMLDAGVNPAGSTSSGGLTRAPGNPNHGKLIPPCNDSCKTLLQHFGVDSVPPPDNYRPPPQ